MSIKNNRMRALFNRFLLTLTIICVFATQAYCQLGKKLTVGLYAGLGSGMGTEKFSENGLSQNVFGSFGAGGSGGINLMYSKSKRIEFGLDVHGMAVSKKNANLGLFSVGPQIQFNLLPSDKNIVPYLAGSINVSFIEFGQKANSNTVYPSNSYSSGSSADVSVTSIQNQNNAVTLGLNGVLGYKLNAGANIKLNSHLWGFAEAGYNSVFVNGNSTVKNNFPDSKGNFNYVSLMLGIKFNLLKSTGLY